MKCEYGVCLCCETPIMNTCKECGTKKPNDQYTEVFVNLSNGSKMAVAVCVDCTADIYRKDRKEIMAAVRAGWEREHDKMQWTPEQRAKYWDNHGEGKLEIVN